MGENDADVKLARHDERIKQLEREIARIEQSLDREVTGILARFQSFSGRLWAAVLMAIGAALNAVSDLLMRGGGQ